MRELGLDPEPAGTGLQYLSDSVAPALALASRISGVLLDQEMVQGEPLLGGIITTPVPHE
ncbi:hypothetical protein ETD85_09315 [Nonomuraea zeae]|uniref:Uncharacterized protein n=1 Tax=Nonomuraea zeae TaxID=1642303 RepID=A0A5S4GWQ5_9ACTN|nr:hypothetical protein ETD85_09315 [Nonomuraea zeae]